MFYDGTNICLISTHFVKGDSDGEFPNFQTMEKFYCIEMYDPQTMN